MNLRTRTQPPAFGQTDSRRSPRGLWARFMSLFGVAILITTLALAAMIVAFVYQTEQSSWRGRQGEAARNAATTVSAFVQRAVDALTTFAIWGRDEVAERPAEFAALLEHNPEYLEVIYLDEHGQLLAQTHHDRPVLADLFTIPQSNWFQAARSGRTYFSNAQISSTNRPYLILALPAGGGDILAARLDLAALWHVVADIQFGQSGRAYIVNGRGEVIAHTDPEVVLAQTSLAGRPELAAIAQAPGGRWQGAYVDLSGAAVVGASAPVPGTDWLVMAELPQAEAFAASRTAGLVVSGLLLGIAAALSYVVARLLSSLIRLPLQQIQLGAERVGHGDLRHRIPVARRDEIGVVAEAFNQMADRLVAREAELAAQAETLRTSEARYRAIVEDQTELICRWRSDGTLTFVNQAYCRYFGRPREDLVGRSFMPLIPDEDQALVAAHLERLQAGHSVETVEHRVILADGTVRWQHWTDRALHGPDGAIEEFAGVGRDITERKAAEARLSAVEQYYRKLFEDAPVMYIVTRAEPEGPRIVDCNRQFLETLGYRAAEVVGQPLDRYYTPASRDQLHAGGYASALAGPLISQERQLVARDGRIVHTLLWALPNPDERGQTAGTRALYVDITERKQAEAALRESEARLQMALEVARAGAWQWDLSANRLVWSDENFRLMGLAPGSVAPALEHWLQAIHPEDQLAATAAVALAVEQRQGFDTEFRVVWPDGCLRWLRAVGRVVLGGDGSPRATVGLQQDITERKQAEAALRESEGRYRLLADELQQLNSQLETRVAERTAELAQTNAALSASETRLRRITDNMLDLIVQVDAAGRCEYVSSSHQTVLGFASADLQGQPFVGLIHPDDSAASLAALAAIQSGVSASLQLRVRHAAGHELWLESVNNPLRDKAGQVVGAILTSRNITQRKQAEQRAAAFSNLGQRLSAVSTVAEAAAVIMAAADELLGWDVCFLDYYLADRELMHSALVIDTLDDGRRVDVTHAYSPSPPTETARRVMASGGVLLRREPSAEVIPGITYFGESTRTASAMLFVPVRNGARFIGILSIQSYADQAYDQRALETLQALADHCGSALERIRAEADVRASLREKEVLLQEIHHRVKNNLQVISSLLNLQSRTLQDPVVLDLLRDSQNRVRSMALVHEKLYRSSDLARIDLAEYVHSLTSQLQHTYADRADRVALQVEAAGSRVDIDTCIACGLILNELISNALKHAFPDGRAGTLTVELRPVDRRRLALRVADDGIGFPAGVDFRTLPSLGLQLVNSLVAQIDGVITLRRAAGTEFVIEFPAEDQEP